MQPTDIMQALRAACHDAHAALHTHPLLVHLHGPGSADYARYRQALAAFEQAYRQLEAARPRTRLNILPSTAPETVPDAPVLAWLQADLATHGIKPLGFTFPAPVFPTAAAEAGYLYVKQGAGLGGQVISRKLRQDLHIEVAGNRFFTGYGDANGREWQAFQRYLKSLPVAATPEAAAAALACFTFIKTCLDRTLDVETA